MLELYHSGLTSCSVKARLCLREKGLDYITRYIRLREFEHHTPEYLAINPNGLVPTLVHDGVAIYETNVIAEYVEETFPDIPLAPKDPYSRAKMRLWSKFSDEIALAAFRKPLWSTRFTEFIRSLGPAELERVLANVPLQERRSEWAKLASEGFEKEELDACMETMEFITKRMETSLSEHPWLAGDTYSLADINMFPWLVRMKEFAPHTMDKEVAPHLYEWFHRVLERPAVKEVLNPSDETPEHDRQGLLYNDLVEKAA